MIRNEFIEKENISFFIAPPTHIKKFATGIGNCKKEMIIDLFKLVEPELAEKIPKVDDIADAYYMSKFARHIYLENNKEDNN
jgi:Holliday junction resolvasome RuvABC endonuclease subunit